MRWRQVQRYFIENNQLLEQKVRVTGDDYHHIVRVMRMETGDEFSAVFPDGRVAICAIERIGEDMVEASILSWENSSRELPVRVAVASGLLKGDKYDLVIQKGTELGANQFIPFTSRRSIVKLDEKKAEKRVERWQKIAKEAAEQSERNHIPTITKPCSFNEMLKVSQSYTLKLVAYEESGRQHETSALYQALQGLNDGESIFILFGPEGGLSEKEIGILSENHFVMCGLGPRILRAETAPLYSLSAISFYFELQR